MKHAYLISSCWYKEKITDPYRVINVAFDLSSIAFYRKTIKGMLAAACSTKIFRKDNPGELLFDLEMIESVINAAYVITKEKKESPLYSYAGNLFDPHLYCGRDPNLTEWKYFPRALSKKEYINPYLVFKRFFKFQSLKAWKEALREVLDCALTTTTHVDNGVRMDLVSMCTHLTKLMEAAHLIDLRRTGQEVEQVKEAKILSPELISALCLEQ